MTWSPSTVRASWKIDILGLVAEAVDVVREVIGAVGDGAERGAGEALGVVVKMVVVLHDGRKAIAPEERRSSSRSPVAQAASWDCRSPITLSGRRTLVATMSQMPCTGLPASMNFT